MPRPMKRTVSIPVLSLISVSGISFSDLLSSFGKLVMMNVSSKRSLAGIHGRMARQIKLTLLILMP